MKKWRCTVCGYVCEGESPVEKCPNCGAPREKFELLTTTGPDLVDWNKIGVARGSGFEGDLNMQFKGECMEVGLYIAMARQAEREGYPEIAETMKRIAWEEAHHAARFAELLGEGLSESTEENLKKLVDGEAGANRGKKEIATRAKKEGQDAIHDAIHEACKDEARHCMAFYGLLKRYFPKA
ncbi:Rubrerythrin [Desulfotomaculum nigrificans CO-1-SRB]|uniref:Rubrerythrin n=1 Tax=Desulfotomaculum nigrificans (strain DSM 14880 / VKM B-2319 / CO-1-SRB) TaxID=868595 RepID=F6B6Z8_DESCC|nr:NADH peroxidase [Desulfotomaculum nigrificans]AEF93323.1 Rubrerythrin [Desulfotomaculum nigrificans CO-1-SRB]